MIKKHCPASDRGVGLKGGEMSGKISKNPKKKVKEVVNVAKAITCPREDLAVNILCTLKKGHHIDLVSGRRRFIEVLEENSTLLSELVTSIEADYVELYKTLKGRHYSDFQIKWLGHIRHVAEYGYALATMDAQPIDEDDVYLPSSESFHKWASICLEFVSSGEDVCVDNNYIMLHQIAKEVYNSKQSQVLESKESQTVGDASTSGQNLSVPTQSSDDSLFRMCGAEIARMIRVKSEQLQKQIRGDTPCDKIASLETEIHFLKSLCVRNEDKSQLKRIIPKGVQNLDLGYLWVPIPSLQPFLVGVDEAFRRHVNSTEFHKYGCHLFEAVTSKFVEERKQLLPQFCSCIGISSLPSPEAHLVYEQLFTKMINLRKEDWKNSNERLQSKQGKRADVTLMLRDQLKPFVARSE